LINFLHGWPELSISWRHQLPVFAELGFRCVAPDMRGYGRSSIYGEHADYAVENSVHDMIELLDSLGRERAVWVGHDWGSPVVWDIASHHPDRCHGVANLCVPYLPKGFAPENFLPLVDRTLYPESKFPAGQWDYQLFYQENFSTACAAFEANTRDTVKALFRKGDPARLHTVPETGTTSKCAACDAGCSPLRHSTPINHLSPRVKLLPTDDDVS
jgi:pimeloyl-ACP methyl ester carboxylesterase